MFVKVTQNLLFQDLAPLNILNTKISCNEDENFIKLIKNYVVGNIIKQDLYLSKFCPSILLENLSSFDFLRNLELQKTELRIFIGPWSIHFDISLSIHDVSFDYLLNIHATFMLSRWSKIGCISIIILRNPSIHS